MTRLLAGGNADAVLTATTALVTVQGTTGQVRYPVVVPGISCTVWPAATGDVSTQLTDLIDDATGNALAGGLVVSDAAGQLPTFRLPDGWTGTRVWIDPGDTSTDRFPIPVRPDSIFLRLGSGDTIVKPDGTTLAVSGGGGTNRITDTAGSTGTLLPDDAEVHIDAFRPDTQGNVNPGDLTTVIGTVLKASLLRGIFGTPIEHLPDSIGPDALNFTGDLPDSVSGLVITVGSSTAPAFDVRQDGTVRINSLEPLLTMGDSALGKATTEQLRALSATVGGWPIVRGATSGDLPDMVAARLGAAPARARVLNRRAASGTWVGDDALGQGWIPAAAGSEVQVRLSCALSSNTGQYEVELGGVKGTLTITETAAAADPNDPGSIAATYDVGTFRRRDPGPGVIVPDGALLQVQLGRRWRHMGLLMPALHHTFDDRYVTISVPLSATGSFVLADSASSAVTAAITIPAPATGTGDDAQARRDADTTLASNIATAVKAAFTGVTGVYVTQGDRARGNLFYDKTRVVTLKFNSTDTARAVTVASSTSGLVAAGALGSGLDDTLDVYEAIIARLTDDGKLRSVFMDTGTVSAEPNGSNRRARFDALVEGIRDMAGPMYAGVWRQLRDPDTLAFYGMNTSDADKTAISQGLQPDCVSTYDDGSVDRVGHLGQAGFRIFFALLAMHLRSRGVVR